MNYKNSDPEELLHHFSRRTLHFAAPPQWESMHRARQLEATGHHVIHFEKGDYQGEEFSAPAYVVDACERALRDRQIRYEPGPGLLRLREAIAQEICARGRPTRPSEVLVTFGAKQALMMTLLCLVSEGDEVIVQNPGYPPDEFWVKYAGGRTVYAPLLEPGFQFDLPYLKNVISPQTRFLILNSPQRPNGMLVENIEDIAEFCKSHDIFVISDEIFSQIVYPPNQNRSIVSLPGMAHRAALIDTFSKTWIMTGFRVGWCVADEELIARMTIFLENSVTNVPVFVQEAALAALTGPHSEVDVTVAKLQNKRDYAIRRLNTMPGLRCETPQGAFYVFVDIRHTGMSSADFANYVLCNFGVAVVPGIAFGDLGEGFVRITFAVPDGVLEEGLDRIKAAIDAL